MRAVLLTGGAGFIGFHLAMKLAESKAVDLYILDNLNAFYSPVLKIKRLEQLGIMPGAQNRWIVSATYPHVHFAQVDIADKLAMEALTQSLPLKMIVHLAAQAGVRFSFDHPDAYIHSNLLGFFEILELSRKKNIEHLLFASSSSVYGANQKIPFHESDDILRPLNLYAATKASNEMMAYAYSSLYKIPMTGLRFFTVYGPYGRPDMAYYKFADHITKQIPIQVHGEGKLQRDFTYIDDIVASIMCLIDKTPQGVVPYEIFNIGNNRPVELMRFIQLLEGLCGQKAILNIIPNAEGEMITTFADIDKLTNSIGIKPKVSIEEGLSQFIQWFQSPDNPLK